MERYASANAVFRSIWCIALWSPSAEADGKVQELRTLGEIYELFGEMLPERLLARNEKSVNSRERSLTPKVTFWAFISQVFDVGSSCRDVVRKVEAWWRWSQKERRIAAPSASPAWRGESRLERGEVRADVQQGHIFPDDAMVRKFGGLDQIADHGDAAIENVVRWIELRCIWLVFATFALTHCKTASCTHHARHGFSMARAEFAIARP